jgi:hypothetical protein
LFISISIELSKPLTSIVLIARSETLILLLEREAKLPLEFFLKLGNWFGEFGLEPLPEEEFDRWPSLLDLRDEVEWTEFLRMDFGEVKF